MIELNQLKNKHTIMEKIPTQIENPKGLHQRYLIKKLIKKAVKVPTLGDYAKREAEIQIHDIDPDAEYFVMRLDDGGKDPKHIAACRIGVNAYADAIKDHLPELSGDLKARYPLQIPTEAMRETHKQKVDRLLIELFNELTLEEIGLLRDDIIKMTKHPVDLKAAVKILVTNLINTK